MYSTSTYFIKGQIPQATVEKLLHLYSRELVDQNVGQIFMTDNFIRFSNAQHRSVSNRYANKFASFTSGQITIEDTEDRFVVTLEADMSRTFIMVGIMAGIITLFLFIMSGFSPTTIIFGCIVFAAIAGIMYAITAVSFPVYFTSLRNDIERSLQEEALEPPHTDAV